MTQEIASEETEPPEPLLAYSAPIPFRRFPPRPGLAPAARRTTARFPSSERSRKFRRQYFPEGTQNDWNDWRWQYAHRFTDEAAIDRVLALTAGEREALRSAEGLLPFAVTPYYASLLDGSDPDDPLRRCVIPTPAEHVPHHGENADPLAEESCSPVPGIVHRYPDRVLFLATDNCSTYCRYCTRSRRVGRREGNPAPGDRERAFTYIARHPEIRDVLVSGGDPLTLPDEALEKILRRLKAIPHVEMIRIGTKVPAVLPQRVTRSLAGLLRRHAPLYVSIHVAHPLELTEEMAAACNRLADAGLPLGSQTVLLAGINDDVAVMKALFHGLLKMRVRPYYLYQCDPIPGSAHFRTPIARGLSILKGLRGHTSGYAIPAYVVDAPGGGGKIQLCPDAVAGRDEGDLLLYNYQQRVFSYPDPGEGM